MTVGLAYRLRQLWANVTAGPLDERARRVVAETLNADEAGLFYRLIPADQWHSYRVLCELRQAGHSDPALLAAALLHDVGKTRCPLSPWDRTMIVAGSALFPRRVAGWGNGSLERWQRPFVVRARHAEWGADMAGSAGSSPATIDLIRRHQDKTLRADDDALRALQWADDRN